MARLAGKFAGILRVDVPDHQVAALKAELVELASAGLHIVIEPGDSDDLGETQSQRLELIGDDRPGIVRDCLVSPQSWPSIATCQPTSRMPSSAPRRRVIPQSSV